jgi:hypothetical protein
VSDSQNEWIKQVLGYEIGRARPRPDSSDAVSSFDLAKLRLAWVDARSAVKLDLDRLRAAALDEFASDPLAANLARLDEVLAAFTEGLDDKLDKAVNAVDPAKRSVALAAAQPVAKRYLDHVLNDSLIDHIETNPFLPVIISGRLLGPLSEIVQALDAAKPL